MTDVEQPPWIYELACYVLEDDGTEKINKFYQGYADTKTEAITRGKTTLDTGHPNPEKVQEWKERGMVESDYASPWCRVVVHWAQFRPDDYYQDISDTEPVADLRREA